MQCKAWEALYYISSIRRHNRLALCFDIESYILHVWCNLTVVGCKLQDCVHVHVIGKQALLKSWPASRFYFFYCCLHSCTDNSYVNVEKKGRLVLLKSQTHRVRSEIKKYSSHLSILSIPQSMLTVCVIPAAGHFVIHSLQIRYFMLLL